MRQTRHQRRYPLRANGTRRRGTYVAGSKKPLPLRRSPRVFIANQHEDMHAKHLLQAQAKNKNMNFQFSDQTKNRPFNSKWKTRMKPRIHRASTTVIPIGKNTYRSKAVQWEVDQSRKAGNKIVAIQIHKNQHHRLPKGIKKKEEMKWNVNKLSEKIRRRK